MDLKRIPCKSSQKKNNEDIWGYIKSQGELYAFETVQQDAVTGAEINFDEISKKVEMFGTVLRKMNLPSGIGICSENNLDFSWIFLGALSAGVRCTLISPRYTARELRHFLELTEPGTIFCSKQISDIIYENGESFGAVCSDYPFIEATYVSGTDKLTHESSPYELLSKLFSDDKNLVALEKQDPTNDRTFDGNREAIVLASSGSTGLPKGVILTHKNVVETLKLSYLFARNRETALGLMPFFHAYGLITALMCLCEGSKLITVPKLQSANYLSDLIEQYQIKNLYLVPSLLATIGKFPTFTKEKLSSVCRIWTSAGKVSRRIQERILEVMPSDAIHYHCYGMTETTFVTIMGPYVKPESSGKLLPNIECTIIQGDWKFCNANEVGELWFRGPMVTKGYLNNETASKELLRNDGWLRSGDLGYRDEEGYYFIVDRIKELIKYQGNQVSPLEIEGLILELPDVLEASVVGLPDEDFGELPAAGVIVSEDSELTEEAVKEHVARQVSTYKRLRGGVFFFNELPKTGSGKVLRKELLAQIMNIICSSPQER